MSELHPETMRVLQQRWYPVVNDLVGGYAVANVDKPLSQHDHHVAGERDIADCFAEVIARHIAELHNASLVPKCPLCCDDPQKDCWGCMPPLPTRGEYE